MNDQEKQEMLDCQLELMYAEQVGELRVCFNLPAKTIVVKKQVQKPSFEKEIRLH